MENRRSKTIIWELLQDLDWQVPDWIVVPGGNLGNTSGFGKALLEAKQAGWISKILRITTAQAQGANPFYQNFTGKFASFTPVVAYTLAKANKIGNWLRTR